VDIDAGDEAAAAKLWGDANPDLQPRDCVVEAEGGRCSEWAGSGQEPEAVPSRPSRKRR
jgi:hypothetical protein